jgi:Glycosyltransferase 61
MHWKRLVLARTSCFLRNSGALSPLRIDEAVQAEKELGRSTENLKILWPAQQRVSLEPTENERNFLKICKYFNDGFYSRQNIFVCEVPLAYCHIGTGLVCTHDFKAISDSQMEYRLEWNRAFKWFKPMKVRRMTGTYATIQNVFWTYWWHWLVDCLPRLVLLARAYPSRQIKLLAPNNIDGTFEESLTSLLPSNFEIVRMPAAAWVKVDRLMLPAYASGRGNGHIPEEYYEFIRRTVFAKFGLPMKNKLQERIYVSRARTRYRRILNERELVELLSFYGFRSVVLEELTFREQVELFHRAAVVVSAYGSNWGNILFSGGIKIFVLYPDCQPETHVFTFSKGLGQEHFFLAGEGKDVNADFSVDLGAVKRVLQDEMNLGVTLPS